MALASKDIHITPQITADDQTVSLGIVYGGNRTAGVLLYKIQKENFTCTTETPRGTAIKFPITVLHQNIQVRCLRKASTTRTINDVTYDVVPRATIDVQTASDPFQLFFAEEWIPPAPIKEIDRP